MFTLHDTNRPWFSLNRAVNVCLMWLETVLSSDRQLMQMRQWVAGIEGGMGITIWLFFIILGNIGHLL